MPAPNPPIPFPPNDPIPCAVIADPPPEVTAILNPQFPAAPVGQAGEYAPLAGVDQTGAPENNA